jgi:hypothetical protein
LRPVRPNLQKDINFLEKVMRRAIKLIYSLRNKSNEDSLKALKLTTLEIRWTRRDLIEVFLKVLIRLTHGGFLSWWRLTLVVTISEYSRQDAI